MYRLPHEQFPSTVAVNIIRSYFLRVLVILFPCYLSIWPFCFVLSASRNCSPSVLFPLDPFFLTLYGLVTDLMVRFYFIIYIYIYILEGVRGLLFIIVGNGQDEQSSNPERSCL